MGSYCYCCMGWTQIRLDLLYIRSLLLHHNNSNNFLLLLHAIFITKRCCLTVGFRFQCGRRNRQKNVGSDLTVGSGVCVDLAYVNHRKPVFIHSVAYIPCRSKNQQEGESVDKCVAELRKLEKTCNFITLEKNLIRVRIITEAYITDNDESFDDAWLAAVSNTSPRSTVLFSVNDQEVHFQLDTTVDVNTICRKHVRRHQVQPSSQRLMWNGAKMIPKGETAPILQLENYNYS
ncbi:hypothetical protein ElyMa_006807800 [Elysia marginata]|uniref:Ubiquitin-like domain-containing protein n=1 Tax=Elysia marginata TaxID=1093978 RepID=A0AAV4J3M8_9GAST|nr:hypothetical protein ElyMa_006807800 [Elysia marginata]